MATCLCVYFGGAVPVSVCQSWSPFFGQGAYSNAGLPGPQSQRTHTRTVKQTQQRLVSQDILNFYWSPKWQPFFYFFCRLTSPHSTFEAVEARPLNSDPAGKAQPFSKEILEEKKQGFSLECLDSGPLNLATVLSDQVMNLVACFSSIMVEFQYLYCIC